MTSIIELLGEVEDTRDQKKVKHPLSTLIFMSICAIFCGADTWEDIPTWVESHLSWLSNYVDISNGVPSYSTIRRMFMLVKTNCWSHIMQQVVALHQPNKQEEDHISVDGKTLRGSKCISKEIKAMQMVSAFSTANSIILSEVTTNSKSNEITAIPVLLDLLELEGCTISIDAIACNEKIITKILDKGAHYLIGLKKNQPKLYAAIEAYAQTWC